MFTFYLLFLVYNNSKQIKYVTGHEFDRGLVPLPLCRIKLHLRITF